MDLMTVAVAIWYGGEGQWGLSALGQWSGTYTKTTEYLCAYKPEANA